MSATEIPKESTLNPPAGSTELEKLRALIADDGFAATFQTMGRYRTALLQVASALARSSTQTADAVVTDHSVEVNKMVEEQTEPKTGEPETLAELTWCIEHGCHRPRTYRALVSAREQLLAAAIRAGQ
ncbi:hypothetical protein N5J06_22580 [Ralstonia sp. CHL-2022]|uniref:Uncharacterized protein n=1 Tax=Ralstonia mojiangensis TaxID=2953895 RepID=A0ABT2LEH7_9RALS|nr:hypothetical protein [Ralstonia mojiangensis]MCT7313766.1 hypothetical protein [Ralstonia mojiangensis]